MKFSNAFIYTQKESPKEAVVPSHKYLVKGGFIIQVASGIYNFLPLGNRVLKKIETIIKEELDSSGCQEVCLGFVTPCDLWEKSGRFSKYGKELLRFKDRKENCFVLGPTHEEMMVELVKNRVNSYKQLPLNLYQIHIKFRDEARPRFGLLRGREFVMKDGYSFHKDEKDMQKEYSLMEETYKKIFTRLGLDFRVVDADVGAIGGSGSKEFMVLAETGEDEIAICSKCSYAANLETAKRSKRDKPVEPPEFSGFTKFYTPGVKTIEELSSFFHLHPYYFLKAIVKMAKFADEKRPVVFFVRGDEELQETKAQNAIGADELLEISEDEIRSAGLVPGFIGPFDLNVEYVIDIDLKGEKGLICGANLEDYHLIDCDLSAIEGKFADIAAVKKGDACPVCGAELDIKKGIEVGHIFQLGTRYSEPLEAGFLDEEGRFRPFVMGTYGIGVSRLVAAIIEQSHDERGCIWPLAVAPYQVDIVVSNIKDDQQREFALTIYDELIKAGVEAILDDREERFGFKMKDFELIGFPYAIIVGKGLQEGKVELVERSTLKRLELPKESLIEEILKRLS